MEYGIIFRIWNMEYRNILIYTIGGGRGRIESQGARWLIAVAVAECADVCIGIWYFGIWCVLRKLTHTMVNFHPNGHTAYSHRMAVQFVA